MIATDDLPLFSPKDAKHKLLKPDHTLNKLLIVDFTQIIIVAYQDMLQYLKKTNNTFRKTKKG